MNPIGLFLTAAAIGSAGATGPTMSEAGAVMSVLDYNVWHGRRPEGIWRLAGEEPERTEQRIAWQIEQIATLAPDVLFLQEVNPAGRLSRRYAESLGYDQVHKVTNCGMSLGPIKIPSNMNEGLAILAHPGLGLRKLGTARLSGPGGCLSSHVGFQTAESRYALFADIRVEGRRVLLVTTHLHNAPRVPPGFEDAVEEESLQGRLTAKQRDTILETLAAERRRVLEEAHRLVDAIEAYRDGRRGAGGFDHVIVAGDFNADAGDAALTTVASAGLVLAAGSGGAPLLTWDPARNGVNQAIGSRTAPALPVFGNRRIEALLMQGPEPARQIDHLLTSEGARLSEIALALEGERNGLFGSDHFGLLASVRLR